VFYERGIARHIYSFNVLRPAQHATMRWLCYASDASITSNHHARCAHCMHFTFVLPFTWPPPRAITTHFILYVLCINTYGPQPLSRVWCACSWAVPETAVSHTNMHALCDHVGRAAHQERQRWRENKEVREGRAGGYTWR
jgi:hypothetical protein